MDRVSTQAEPEVAKLIRERFILVAGDRWYHTRQRDAEGRFVAKLDEQAQLIRSGKQVQQGLYCFSADGQLLSWCNRNAHLNRSSLQNALTEWDKLPAEKRKPGSIKIEPRGQPDRRYVRQPPVGGLVVNVFIRALDKRDGDYCVGTSSHPGGTLAGRDRMWVTKNEWKALVPDKPNEGDEIPVPDTLRRRMLCYHLCDHTRGQALAWYVKHIRTSEMKLTVTRATVAEVKTKLVGSALLSSGANADVSKARRGFDVAFLGHINFDRAAGRITKFDFVAIGDHWGDSPFNRGARPGRTPLGVAYELCPKDDPGRGVPPLQTTDLRAYLQPK